MQGLYRIALALIVVFHHLAHDHGWFSGNFAVLGFYTLSGYLIAGALKTNYGTDPANLKRFALNRFLRLYPGYWAALCVAIVAVFLFPAESFQLNPAMRNPADVTRMGISVGWYPQILMAGLQVPPAFLSPVRLIPPAWSTSLELYFYAALALTSGLSNKAFARVVAGCALAALACIATGRFQWTYTSIFGVAIFFAAGAMAWREKQRLQALLDRHRLIVPACLASFLGFAFAPEIFHRLRVESYIVWAQYAVLAQVAILAHVAVASRKGLPKRADAWLADLSYPVFLLHYPVAAIARGLTGLSDARWVALSVASTLALALLVVAAVEHPIRGLRRKVRGATA